MTGKKYSNKASVKQINNKAVDFIIMKYKPNRKTILTFKPNTYPNKWKSLRGFNYDFELKKNTLVPFLSQLDKRGLLDRNLLDIGSGSADIITRKGFLPNAGFFYNTDGKNVVRVDVGFSEEKQKGNILEIPLDVEAPEKIFGFLRKVVRVKKFLNGKPFDTALFSDVLNYVDYEEVLSKAKNYIKPNGLIVVFNKPGRGFSSLFSEKGVKTNEELINFLHRLGFEFLHCAGIKYKFPSIRKVGSTEYVLIVARKKK